MKRIVKGKRACRGRIRYRDEAQAVIALRGIRARSNRDRIPCRAYYCGRCNGWHLTATERRT